MSQDSFTNRSEAERFITDLENLHRDPSRTELARSLQLGPDLLDEEQRTREVRNWLCSLDPSH